MSRLRIRQPGVVDGRRRAWGVAIAALMGGYVSAVVLAVDGNGDVGGAFTGGLTIYGWSQATLSVVLIAAGSVLLVVRRSEAIAGLLGVVGLCAAQLAGAGLVGVRRWPLFWGCCAPPVSQQELVRNLPWAMAAACGTAALLALLVLVRRHAGRRRGAALVAWPLALVVAVAVPPLAAPGGSDTGDLVALALIHSLPFAAALAASALLTRSAALVVTGAVAVTATAAAFDASALVSFTAPREAMALVLVAAVVVAGSRSGEARVRQLG